MIYIAFTVVVQSAQMSIATAGHGQTKHCKYNPPTHELKTQNTPPSLRRNNGCANTDLHHYETAMQKKKGRTSKD